MIVKWLGHASFLLKASGKNLYIDPYAGEYVEKADVILITHNHRDHCDSDKIKAIRRADTLIVTSLDCASGLEGNVVSMSPSCPNEKATITIIHRSPCSKVIRNARSCPGFIRIEHSLVLICCLEQLL